MSGPPVQITLERSEARVAADVGVFRHLSSLYRERADNHGADQNWDYHIVGAFGEMVVAKWLGVYWDGSVDSFKRADIGSKLQIRLRTRHDFDLIVRHDDRDDHVFLLVTGLWPKPFCIRGYLFGRDAKREEWLRDYGNRGAREFFVPQAALLPLDGFRAALAGVEPATAGIDQIRAALKGDFAARTQQEMRP